MNALAILDLIPSQRHLVRSKEDWTLTVDAFMNRNFEDTMGRMIKNLNSVTEVPTDLEVILADALKKRNWLAHGYFRERATEFMSPTGREQMLHEVDECRILFQTANERLEGTLAPIRAKEGITDEWIEREYLRILDNWGSDEQKRMPKTALHGITEP